VPPLRICTLEVFLDCTVGPLRKASSCCNINQLCQGRDTSQGPMGLSGVTLEVHANFVSQVNRKEDKKRLTSEVDHLKGV